MRKSTVSGNSKSPNNYTPINSKLGDYGSKNKSTTHYSRDRESRIGTSSNYVSNNNTRRSS